LGLKHRAGNRLEKTLAAGQLIRNAVAAMSGWLRTGGEGLDGAAVRPGGVAVRAGVGLAAATAVFLGLLWVSGRSYILFHCLAELFSVAVAGGIFVIAWNTRRLAPGGFFLTVGTAFLFVGALDLLHTLAYEGMGVLPGHVDDSNAATQLWISARYMQAAAMLAGVFLVRRRPNAYLLLGVFAAACAALLLTIFAWRVFPACYVEGRSAPLTPFKVVSEYVICGMSGATAVGLLLRRRWLHPGVLALLVGSLAVTIASELAFTLYKDVYDSANELGHFLKIVSFYLVYRALIQTGLTNPFAVLFRDLKQVEERLREALGSLEERVRERTADLSKAMGQLDYERRRLLNLLHLLPGYVALIDEDHTVRFANDKFLAVFGPPEGRCCHEVIRARGEPCEDCFLPKVLHHGQAADWERTGADGRVYHVWGHPFRDVDGRQAMLELGLDVTERRRLEGEVLKATELERRRIGQDLHDSLGQTLSGLSCLSQVLQQRLAASSRDEAEQAAQMHDILTEAVGLTRSLARGLSPVGAGPDGLATAMRELAENVQAMFRIRCEFVCPREVPVHDGMVATHLYRIAQEATNNAARHGRARSVRIELSRANGSLMLRISDDGAGLPDDAENRRGMGLRTMSYRARAVGGSIRFERGAAGGTVVTCVLPAGADASETTEEHP